MGECAHNNWNDLNVEEIFNLHHHRVYVLCLRMTGNVEEAEGLTQNVFVEVFRQRRSFPRGEAFSTWLHRLTVNRVLMHFRRNLVRKEQTRKDDERPAAAVESSKRFNRSPVLGISQSRLRKARLKLRQLLRAESGRVRSTPVVPTR